MVVVVIRERVIYREYILFDIVFGSFKIKILLSWVFGEDYFLYLIWYFIDVFLERKSGVLYSGKDRRVVGLYIGRSMFYKDFDGIY